jgi:DNA-binding GntR family transcriptional regulator
MNASSRDGGAQAEDDISSGQGAVERAAEAIRSLVLSRELFPGQRLGQDDLSVRIGTSRGPTREALRALSKEGLITHIPNRGYAVARFDISEMTQMYMLRDLGESEILRTVVAPTEAQLQGMRKVNDQIRDPSTSVEEAMRLNREFHFSMFELSPHKLIISEIDRWWNMSMAYRALSIAIWEQRAEMMSAAHDAQIAALADKDYERLVELCREHRWVSLKRMSNLLV